MSALVEAVRAAVGQEPATGELGAGAPVLDVAAARWHDAAAAALGAGAAFFDLLTAYDLEESGFAVVLHVSLPDASDHLLLRTAVPRDEPVVGSVVDLWPGAAWHERETHEMYGVRFAGHDALEPLLLAGSTAVHPLRKDVVLVARPSRPWPGDKDPADSTGRPRRRTPPPGVPADWPRTEP